MLLQTYNFTEVGHYMILVEAVNEFGHFAGSLCLVNLRFMLVFAVLLLLNFWACFCLSFELQCITSDLCTLNDDIMVLHPWVTEILYTK